MSHRARNPFRYRLWGLAAALAMGTPLADATAQAPNPSAPPSSREVLRAMSETLQAAERIRFRAEIAFDDVLDDGQKLQFGGALDVAIRKPDGLAADYRDDLSAKQLWYDGKTFTIFDPDHDVYATTAAPSALGPAMAQLERDQGVALPLAALVIGNPYEKVMQHALRGSYLGIHEVDGAGCHHVAFVGENTDFRSRVPDDAVATRFLAIREDQ